MLRNVTVIRADGKARVYGHAFDIYVKPEDTISVMDLSSRYRYHTIGVVELMLSSEEINSLIALKIVG